MTASKTCYKVSLGYTHTLSGGSTFDSSTGLDLMEGTFDQGLTFAL